MKKIGEYYADYLNQTLDMFEYNDEEKQYMKDYLDEPQVVEVFNTSGIPIEELFDDKIMADKYKITLAYLFPVIHALLFEKDIYTYNPDIGDLEAHHHNILDERHNPVYTFKIRIQLTEQQPVFVYSIHDETTNATVYQRFPLSEFGKSWAFRRKDAEILLMPKV